MVASPNNVVRMLEKRHISGFQHASDIAIGVLMDRADTCRRSSKVGDKIEAAYLQELVADVRSALSD